MRHIEQQLPDLMRELKWINLGGGYLLEEASELEGLSKLVRDIQKKWHTDVYFEPGKAIINNAGYLISSVIDQFESDGKLIAVLDTSVNHLPGVFEYQTPPKLVDATPDAPYPVILAGCTCLSGDLFGEYRLPYPLTIGDRVIFEHVGAYSLIKASRFNGQNLPSIYTYNQQQGLKLAKRYSYEDYRQQWVE
jgi:carboxynorspermidine decarboxylase